MPNPRWYNLGSLSLNPLTQEEHLKKLVIPRQKKEMFYGDVDRDMD
jgi:hypothetical protein